MHPWHARTVVLPFPCKLGILSDTHAANLKPEYLDWLSGVFRDVARVIHLGDVVYPSVFSDLEAQGYALLAVKGNNDRLLNTPSVLILESGPYRIGATHGGGGAYRDVAQRALRQVQSMCSEPLHAVLYGHTHVPELSEMDSMLFFNPGSFGHPRKPPGAEFPAVSSVGTLAILESGLHFEHHFLPVPEKK